MVTNNIDLWRTDKNYLPAILSTCTHFICSSWSKPFKLARYDLDCAYIMSLNNKTTFEPCHEKTGFLHMRKNKDADQLRGNHEADQRLCFRYIDSTIPLLSKYEISSL